MSIQLPHPISDAARLDDMTLQAYKEFHENNKKLFKEDPLEYHSLARTYVEERVIELKYGVESVRLKTLRAWEAQKAKQK